jgi:hypothetical protein
MYRVMTYPNGEKRWHCVGDEQYPGFVSEREATPAEAAIMEQILAEDAAGEMPDPELGVVIRRLMAETVS